MDQVSKNHIPSQWNDAAAPKSSLEALVYASNLLGSDPRVTNYGGGNTSVKAIAVHPLTGEKVEVMWVKASGGDLGSAKSINFAALEMDKFHQVAERAKKDRIPEDDVVAMYAHCAFNLNSAAPSIDTPLHAVVPKAAVSHLHPDSIIAIAASENAERLTQEVFKGELGFLPWKRPGFDLALMLQDMIQKNPNLKGAVMQSHGFICWEDDWKACYELSISLINLAEQAISGHASGKNPFGSLVELKGGQPAIGIEDLLVQIRGNSFFEGQRLIASFDQSPDVVDFLTRDRFEQLARLGTSCPDHFLRTKIRPLVLEPHDSVEQIKQKYQGFRDDYQAYYSRCKSSNSPKMRNPNPSIVLVKGVGMISLGKNPHEAKVSGEFFRNAINVMKGAETLSKYVSLSEQEAFNIEYWDLEEAKLKRQPPEQEFARQIAVITGGASGIGLATARRMAALGACVALLDINKEGLEKAKREIESIASVGSVLSVECNVTDRASIELAFSKTIRAFGGIDIVVANAGNARRGSVADTSPEDYSFLSDLLMKGYFETVGAGVRWLVKQGTGGAVVIVGSKNGVAAGSNAALYSAAKAFELHLMRVTAADFAKHRVRCNAINPDGVVTDSAIWSDAWKTQTAASLGISPDELVDYYAKRSLLGTVVTPNDCAEAICWLASEKRSSRTTGCIIPVDGGNKEGFLR